VFYFVINAAESVPSTLFIQILASLHSAVKHCAFSTNPKFCCLK